MEHVSTEIANQGLYGLAENARNRIQAPVKGFLPNHRTESPGDAPVFPRHVYI